MNAATPVRDPAGASSLPAVMRQPSGATAPPATQTESDRLARLGESIAELASRLHAVTYELLVLIREFDACAGWNDGFRSCAHWLNWRTGIDLGAAREKVRVARALADLPVLSAAMQRGSISYSKVRAITRVATPECETQLVDIALAGTAAHVERIVRAWRRADRVAAAAQAQQQYLDRHLDVWVDDDGMAVIRGRLTPEVGAVVQRALEAAADRLRREAEGTPRAEALQDEVTPGQRRADALARVAECALAADLDGGTAGDRYQVVLHVEPAALRASGVAGAAPGTAGHTVLEGLVGQHVSAETSQRIACDAGLVVVTETRDGSVLDVGRRTRTIPPAIRRALEARDRRCRFPGCTALRCDAHHIVHWADGGGTRLDNLVLLCRHHHRAIHEGGWSLARGDNGTVIFVRPNGVPLPVAPDAPHWLGHVSPLAPTLARLAARGLSLDPDAGLPAWLGEPLDVVWAIDVLRQSPVTSHQPASHKSISRQSSVISRKSSVAKRISGALNASPCPFADRAHRGVR